MANNAETAYENAIRYLATLLSFVTETQGHCEEGWTEAAQVHNLSGENKVQDFIVPFVLYVYRYVVFIEKL